MSDTPTKPVAKGRTVKPKTTGSPSASSAAAINDDVIPILLAANPALHVNYRQMVVVDPQHRTYSAWEHRFRKWKAKAKELADATANGNEESSKDAGDMGGNTTAEPSIAAKRKNASPLGSQDSNDKADAPIKKSKVMKKAPAKAKVETDMITKEQAEPEAATKDDEASEKPALPIRPTTARKGPVKAPTFGEEASAKNEEDLDNDGEDNTSKANSSKKRDETTQDAISGSPPKKARGEKKGTAKIVKKKTKKPTETGVEFSEAEDSASEEVVKPKAGARAGKKGTARVVKKKAAKPTETEEQISAGENDGGEAIVKAKTKAKGGKAAGAAKPVTKGKGKAGNEAELEEGELVEMQLDEK